MSVQPEQIEIHLRFKGPSVDDGTMSVEDIIPILQGFSSAYGKLAISNNPNATHRLRISNIGPGSADIILIAWEVFEEHHEAIIPWISAGAGEAWWIVKRILEVIRAKLHVKDKPFHEEISQSNNIYVVNSSDVKIEMPIESYKVFKTRAIDGDLDRITTPLVKDRIEEAEITVKSAEHIAQEKISLAERPYFKVDDEAVTSTRETWLDGRLNSLTKSTNSGWLLLTDGTRVFYNYKGDDKELIYELFGTCHGLVRVQCVAHMDKNLKIISLDVSKMERIQGSLFGPSVEENEQT